MKFRNELLNAAIVVKKEKARKLMGRAGPAQFPLTMPMLSRRNTRMWHFLLTVLLRKSMMRTTHPDRVTMA